MLKKAAIAAFFIGCMADLALSNLYLGRKSKSRAADTISLNVPSLSHFKPGAALTRP
jgi:hypothetical protein